MTSATSGRHARFRHFLRTVASTHDRELDCEEVNRILARYVEVEVSGGSGDDVAEGVPLHLSHCPHCAEMYETLRHLADLEAHDELPEVGALWCELRGATRAASASA